MPAYSNACSNRSSVIIPQELKSTAYKSMQQHFKKLFLAVIYPNSPFIFSCHTALGNTYKIIHIIRSGIHNHPLDLIKHLPSRNHPARRYRQDDMNLFI